MHILEIPSFFPPYGGEFCLEQSKALKALGHEVRIISNVQLSIKQSLREFACLPNGRWWETMDGVDAYRSYQRGIPKVIRPNVRRWVSIVESMFADYVGQYGKPDVLHAHCAKWAGYAAMLIGGKYGIPYVITEHLPKEIFQAEFGTSPSGVWQIPLLRESYQKAANVIMVSEELADDLACYFAKDYRMTTVSNMIDVDFYAYRERQPLKNRSFCFCCPAIYVERKGYDVLFEAFDRLVRNGADSRLVIAGRGTDGKDCKARVSTLVSKDRITCLGFLKKPQIRQMLYESDAMVLATRGESQGLVLLEAMSTGIPVISTEAIPRSVRMKHGAYYVPVDDVGALEAQMRKMMDMPAVEGKELSLQVRRCAAPQIVAAQIERVLLSSLK